MEIHGSIYMGYGQQFLWRGEGVAGGGSLNEKSSKREVFRLFIFHIVSQILQQTSMIFIKLFY